MSHQHHHQPDGSENLKVAFFLNLGFTIIEIAGGIWTNSMAILSDALHDAGDCLSIGASWYLQRLSKRGSNERFTYGYRRFSVLGALITGVVLLIGMIVILSQAIPRIMNPEPVDAKGMMGLAVLGIAVNGFAAYRASKGSSLNEGIVSWHLLEDVLGWVAVLFGSLAMTFWDLPIIDPLLSIGIALFILRNVWMQLHKMLRVFLQEVPESFDYEDFEERLKALPHVRSIHHLHSWSLDGERHVLTVHVVVDGSTKREDVSAIKRAIKSFGTDSGFEHLTVEIEHADDDCSTPDKIELAQMEEKTSSHAGHSHG